jgi:hypothetical protein
MKPSLAFLRLLLALLLAGAIAVPASADDGAPPPDSAWDPIVNEDGGIDVSGLTDLGVQEVPADWMPSLPILGDLPATYHLYQDPAGGTVYMIPTVTTYLFMAANPDESGLGSAIGALSGNAENSSGYSADAAFLAGIVSGNLDFSAYSEFITAGYTDWTDFFNAVLSGETDLWSLPLEDTFNFLLDMRQMSVLDGNLYSAILAFPPAACDQLPGGCPAGMAMPATTPPDILYDNPSCPSPFTTTRAISVSGGKLAPAHPVVVGQDPQRRGVDIQAEAHIPLITYHYYETVFHQERLCVLDPGKYATNAGCPGPADRYSKKSAWTDAMIGNKLYTEKLHVWSTCREHTRDYVDQLASATLTLSLRQESRQWILTSLQQSYPGAHLIHPDFSFTVPGPGSPSGGSVVWSRIFPNLPIADPGYWTVTLRVNTTGTPVSGPRFATLGLGTFLDELVRVTLVDGMGGNQP